MATFMATVMIMGNGYDQGSVCTSVALACVQYIHIHTHTHTHTYRPTPQPLPTYATRLCCVCHFQHLHLRRLASDIGHELVPDVHDLVVEGEALLDA